jgi:TRAP-type C4-dicarboxylate transport system permease small subunit
MKMLDRAFLALVYLAGLLVLVIALTTMADVGLRYLVNRPLRWTSDLSGYLQLYAVFLGAVWVARIDGHVRVDVLTNFLNRKLPRVHAALLVISDVLTVVTLLVVVWLGMDATLASWRQGLLVQQTLVVPRFTLLVVIPLACLLMAVAVVRRLLEHAEHRTG